MYAMSSVQWIYQLWVCGITQP